MTLLEELDKLSRAEAHARHAIEAGLRDQVGSLTTENEALKAELEKTKALLNRDSAELLALRSQYEVDTFRLMREAKDVKSEADANKEYAHSNVQSLRASLTAAQAALVQERSKADAANARARAAEDALAALQSSSARSIALVQDLEDEHKALEATKNGVIEELELELRALRRQMDELSSLESDFAALGNQHAILRSKVTDIQADRARERAELEDALHQLEYEAALLKTKLAEEAAAKRDALHSAATTQEELDAVATERGELAARLKALQAEFDSLSTLKAGLDVEHEKVIRERTTLSAETAELKARARTYDEIRAEVMEEMNEKIAYLQAKLDEARMDNDALEERLEVVSRAAAKAQTSYESTIRTLEADLASLRAQLADARSYAGEQEKLAQDLQRELDDQMGALTAAEREIGILSSQIAGLEGEVKDALGAAAAAETALQEVKDQAAKDAAEAAEALDVSKGETAQVTMELEKLQAAYNDIEAKLVSRADLIRAVEDGKQRVAELEKEVEDLRAKLENAEARARDAEASAETFRNAADRMTAEHDKIAAERDSLRNQLRRLESEHFAANSDAVSEAAQLQRALSSLEAELAGFRAKRDEWRKKYDALLDAYTGLEDRSATEANMLRHRVLELNKACAELERRLMDEIALRAALQARLDPHTEVSREALEALRKELSADFDAERERLHGQISALNRETGERGEEVAYLQKELARARAKVREAEEAADAAGRDAAGVERVLLPQIEALQSRVDGLSRERDALRSSTAREMVEAKTLISELRSKNTSLQGRYDDALSRIGDLEGKIAMVAGLEKDLEAARSGREMMVAEYETVIAKLRAQLKAERERSAQAEMAYDDAQRDLLEERKARAGAERESARAVAEEERLEGVLVGKIRGLQTQLADLKARNREVVEESMSMREELMLRQRGGGGGSVSGRSGFLE